MAEPPPPVDRFSEEAATYAVRGRDTPDLAAGAAAIRAVLRTLPARPGVYRMLDAAGEVLYVGKARSLKARVSSYVEVTRLPRRLQRMVALTRAMAIVTTESEAGALLQDLLISVTNFFRDRDAFEALAALKADGEQFDVVILDPPAFIKKRKDIPNGERAYARLNREAMRLLGRDGLLLSASCSMHLAHERLVDVVRGAVRHQDRHGQVIFQGHQGPDHPVHPAIPETAYLKALGVRVFRD